MANPVGINSYVTNFFSPSNLHLGVTHSVNNIGGYQEFATIAERNAIPTTPNSASAQPYNGFTLNDDKWSSGRRTSRYVDFCNGDSKTIYITTSRLF